MSLHLRIEAHALANAAKYNGKANPNNVLPKIIGEFPEQKSRIAELRKEIEQIVGTVNTLNAEEQMARLKEIAPELLEKKPVKEKELPPLSNAVIGKVVTRFPPEPSKYPHLGHAITALINWTYAQRYQGKLVLRLEDANPEKVNQEFVDMMLADVVDYLGIMPNDIRFVSDDMDALNQYATKLIEADGAYMCFCDRERMSAYRQEGKECDCRHKPQKEQLLAWHEFQSGKYSKGEAVLRFKGNMQSQNTVMRDPVLYRAVPVPHFRVGSKYHIWPTYDFYSPIEEVLCGVTHVLRSNEFDLRVELQQAIHKKLGLPDQEVLQYGRLNITGAVTQGREIREGIEKGEFMGWDDPRLVTLKALKRRGIQPQAYQELVKNLGLSPYPVSLDFSMLAAANRKLIEHVNRYSFVENPQEIHIEGAQHKEIELDLHPERKGGRKMQVGSKVIVSSSDLENAKGKKVRLMGLLTLQEQSGKHTLLSYEQRKDHDLIINWLPAEGNVPVEIMMPDASLKQGVAEKGISHLQVNDIIQFERFGFCRLDAIENGVHKFWYTHK